MSAASMSSASPRSSFANENLLHLTPQANGTKPLHLIAESNIKPRAVQPISQDSTPPSLPIDLINSNTQGNASQDSINDMFQNKVSDPATQDVSKSKAQDDIDMHAIVNRLTSSAANISNGNELGNLSVTARVDSNGNPVNFEDAVHSMYSNENSLMVRDGVTSHPFQTGLRGRAATIPQSLFPNRNTLATSQSMFSNGNAMYPDAVPSAHTLFPSRNNTLASGDSCGVTSNSWNSIRNLLASGADMGANAHSFNSVTDPLNAYASAHAGDGFYPVIDSLAADSMSHNASFLGHHMDNGMPKGEGIDLTVMNAEVTQLDTWKSGDKLFDPRTMASWAQTPSWTNHTEFTDVNGYMGPDQAKMHQSQPGKMNQPILSIHSPILQTDYLLANVQSSLNSIPALKKAASKSKAKTLSVSTIKPPPFESLIESKYIKELIGHQDMVEQISDVVLIISSRGIVLYVSPRVKTLLGFSPELMVSHMLSEFLHAGDFVSVLRDCKEAEIAIPFFRKCRAKSKGGGYMWIEISGRKYQFSTRKKTKCYIMSLRRREEGILDLQFLTHAVVNNAKTIKLTHTALISNIIETQFDRDSAPFSPLFVSLNIRAGQSLLPSLVPEDQLQVKTLLRRTIHSEETPISMILTFITPTGLVQVFVYLLRFTSEHSYMSIYPHTPGPMSEPRGNAFESLNPDRPTAIQFELNQIHAENTRLREMIGIIEDRATSSM